MDYGSIPRTKLASVEVHRKDDLLNVASILIISQHVFDRQSRGIVLTSGCR